MTQVMVGDFGRLYRAAFAERDPEKKSHLLREVQQLLHVWRQAEDGQPSPRKLVSSAAASASSIA
jgi:hypothetical protein